MSDNEIARSPAPDPPMDGNRVQSLLAYLEHLRSAGIDIEPHYSLTSPFAHNPLPMGQERLLSLNQPLRHH